MQTTIHTPRGSKLRTATQRRFVVVGEVISKDRNLVNSAWIDKRSDSVDTLRAHIERANRNARSAEAWFTARVIIDTTTGQAV